MRDAKAIVRISAAQGLLANRREASTTIPILVGELSQQDEALLHDALCALSCSGSRAEEAVPTLLQLTESKEVSVDTQFVTHFALAQIVSDEATSLECRRQIVK